ncbi:hypothetical protein [Serratia sp. JSRIV006]|uniref:hypothetical protein n=1 Tax=Serratia sp. JSRIV006 TaxID=2831896 RepID=UPI001CBAD59A|nr:hypothetical protein [Serratia sp. JSRIV006]UAN64262.1 hypothetical protein KGP16_06720 [Serratia sp. JSRIV006]
MKELLDNDDLFVSHMLGEISEEMTDELAAIEAAADFRSERQAQQMGIGYE